MPNHRLVLGNGFIHSQQIRTSTNMNNNEKLPIGTKVIVRIGCWKHIPDGRSGVIIELQDDDDGFDYRVRLTRNGGLGEHEMPVYASEITPVEPIVQKTVVQFFKQAQREQADKDLLEYEKFDDGSVAAAISGAFDDVFDDVERMLSDAIKARLIERYITPKRLLIGYLRHDYDTQRTANKAQEYLSGSFWNMLANAQDKILNEELEKRGNKC